MEDYLQYMRTLRSQMNDVEDQAAKISAEEESLLTAIRSMEKDLDSAKSDAKKLKEGIEEMVKEKGQICTGILAKQRKIASLESDSSTLLQTLELIQREKVNLSAKIVEKRAYYAQVFKDMDSELQQQQEWFNAQRSGGGLGVHGVFDGQTAEAGGKSIIDSCLTVNNQDSDTRNSTMTKLDSVKAKLSETARMKSELVVENNKMYQLLEQAKCRAKDLMPDLLKMDFKTLDEEYNALLSDKAGEFEYAQSLQLQIEKLKGISHLIKCSCGMEFRVAMDLYA
ncbi:hypothetical protein Tsubulata_001410 [Turnera subulata]|uniref:Uncharacterized protein n=1 Tax=Turnera subulata TaxID=218843 RepID=A0A9Q0FEX6_9ROSI|nr:hypothetical protein Tsubulata_001410 [Turnera subulata]